MKKIMVFIVILLTSLSLFAMSSSITMGYQSKRSNNHVFSPIYTSLHLWQDIDNFKLYCTYTSEMQKSTDSWGFTPSQDYFTVGASYNFKQITLRVEHQCSHPVVPNGHFNGIDSDYTKFEITIGDTI